jgi:DNA-binding XRE family transcriptional regulator
MPQIQTFKTPAGEEMVILSRAEYDALVDAAAEAEEDAADAAIYAQRKAALASGDDAVLPPEVSAAVHRGDSRLKAIRKWRGLGQVELAEAISISQGHLSDIENGRRDLTTVLAGRLAAHLNVPSLWLLDQVVG